MPKPEVSQKLYLYIFVFKTINKKIIDFDLMLIRP